MKKANHADHELGFTTIIRRKTKKKKECTAKDALSWRVHKETRLQQHDTADGNKRTSRRFH